VNSKAPPKNDCTDSVPKRLSHSILAAGYHTDTAAKSQAVNLAHQSINNMALIVAVKYHGNPFPHVEILQGHRFIRFCQPGICSQRTGNRKHLSGQGNFNRNGLVGQVDGADFTRPVFEINCGRLPQPVKMNKLTYIKWLN
jgi:hypothetical protein